MKEANRHKVIQQLLDKKITEEDALKKMGLKSVLQVRRIKKRMIWEGIEGVIAVFLFWLKHPETISRNPELESPLKQRHISLIEGISFIFLFRFFKEHLSFESHKGLKHFYHQNVKTLRFFLSFFDSCFHHHLVCLHRLMGLGI